MQIVLVMFQKKQYTIFELNSDDRCLSLIRRCHTTVLPKNKTFTNESTKKYFLCNHIENLHFIKTCSVEGVTAIIVSLCQLINSDQKPRLDKIRYTTNL